MTAVSCVLSPVVYAKAALILISFALFATENYVHYPVALMSLLGLAQIAWRPRDCLTGQARTLLIVFGLIWIPMLIAWPFSMKRVTTLGRNSHLPSR